MDTKTLRKQIRQQRRALSHAERKEAALLLYKRLSRTSIFKNSQHIAFYLSNDGEIDLSFLIQHAWKDGKKCYLPVLAKPNTSKLWFIPYTAKTKLKYNRFGIPEPIHSAKTRSRKTQSLDLILMPLVAFDEQGNRMGMGGGFYDRTLAFLRYKLRWHKPNLVGVAYELQKQSKLITNYWDIPMQAVATEQNLYINSKN